MELRSRSGRKRTFRRLSLVVVQLLLAGQALAQPGPDREERTRQTPVILEAQAGRSCKSVQTCQEAVELWCSGYKRADADHDGIPCENVCRSKDQVDKIRAEIGC